MSVENDRRKDQKVLQAPTFCFSTHIYPKKKEKKKYGKPLELMMKIPKRGTLLFSSNMEHNNFNMTTYNFAKKRNITTYNRLKQISKTFSKKKKQERK